MSVLHATVDYSLPETSNSIVMVRTITPGQSKNLQVLSDSVSKGFAPTSAVSRRPAHSFSSTLPYSATM
ncbi:hypothetical protein HZ326_20549 [Fusarium oxysporum f. sp. albedinis]|nr:hypothetical protein HZ326_20549 [Fusarium oxysporum f. sp. albedinis]